MIAISGLTKRYGDRLAVDDATFEIPSGSICGLLGRSGAGKTTTLKCMLNFARPDAGDVRFDGKQLAPATFAKLGYVPERPQLYGWMTVAEHLDVVRRTQPRYDDARAITLLATFRLDSRNRASKLSKGQQAALALIIALAGTPSLLILDEPASGMDPMMQRAVLDLLIEAAANGATILLSSHQIWQVHRAADRIAIMRDGKIVLSGEVDALREASRVVEATFDGAIPNLGGLPDAMRIEYAGTSVRAHANGHADAVAARFATLGAVGVRILERSLEDVFVEAVDDGGAH